MLMARYFNPGTVNIDSATNSILENGGGIHEKGPDSTGTTHISVYSTNENRHLSYDRDSEGHYSHVHTDKDNHGYTDYKGEK